MIRAILILMASAENRDVGPGQPPVSLGTTASSPHAKMGGGIFDGGLAAYRTMTDEDYRGLFATGLIVLDTNTLLNLYRYHPATRVDLLSILTRLRDRIWIPRHVMAEFFQGRASVIGARSKELNDTVESLRRSEVAMEGIIRAWTNRVGMPRRAASALVDDIRKPVNDVIHKIRQLGRQHAFEQWDDTSKDPILVALDSILSENVGAPFAEDELQRVKATAIERIGSKTPPGWRDAEKRINPEGDYIIWYETVREAKQRRRDVLFITGDVKADWWHMHAGEARGPLPELVQEMKIEAGVQLFMLRPASLLIHASRVLDLNVSKESVQDAEQVSIEPVAYLTTPEVTPDGGKASGYQLTIFDLLEFEAGMSARHWQDLGREPRFNVVRNVSIPEIELLVDAILIADDGRAVIVKILDGATSYRPEQVDQLAGSFRRLKDISHSLNITRRLPGDAAFRTGKNIDPISALLITKGDLASDTHARLRRFPEIVHVWVYNREHDFLQDLAHAIDMAFKITPTSG